MALPPKVISAMNAMKNLGFSWERTKPVLKDLLITYENNWGHIEAENYRVLADAVLDSLESEEGDLKKERHNEKAFIKKDNIGYQGMQDSQFSVTEKSRKKMSSQPLNGLGLINESSGNVKTQNLPRVKCSLGENDNINSSRTDGKDKRPVHQVLDTSVCYKQTNNAKKRKLSASGIKKPPAYKAPRLGELDSSACPPQLLPATIAGHQELPNHHNLSKGSCSSWQIVPAQNVEKRKWKETSLNQNGKNDFPIVDSSVQSLFSTNLELASSTSGKIRLLALCNPPLPCPNFQMPRREVLCKVVEDRFLKSYKILDPHFSLLSLLKEICNCVVELGNEQGNFDMICGNGQPHQMNLKIISNDQSETSKDINDNISAGAVENDMRSMVVFQQPQHYRLKTDAVCDTDICRGEENVKISLSNAPNAERYPTSFHYIPRNIVYQNAYVNISLARIGDEDCCSTCSGDCLAASIPCPCARETGGDYAYTSGGLMKREFLDAILSMKRHQLKENLFFCKDCPIERLKNETMPESCKGHSIRKFVKECWSKCGCNRVCGNRLVQRGITCNLQVFWTAERKGWGLRTLDELPKGAFICEYVGEILTNTELYERQLKVTGKMRHTYPVLLDADWGSEQVLKDEEALCLDATFYGNVARFINHRCADANVVDVPIEIEIPDHHYYHLAFFTVREVEALEELTWDYGIDFTDHTHPIKAFSCQCGSKFCRGRPQIQNKQKIKKRPALVFG